MAPVTKKTARKGAVALLWATALTGAGIFGTKAVEKVAEKTVEVFLPGALQRAMYIKSDVVDFGGDNPATVWPLVYLPPDPKAANSCPVTSPKGWRCVCPIINMAVRDAEHQFLYPPHIVVSVKGFDILNKPGVSMRFDAWPDSDSVTIDSFRLTACTWGDTQVYGAEVEWTAIGASKSKE